MAETGKLSRECSLAYAAATVISGEAAAVDPVAMSWWLMTSKGILEQHKPSKHLQYRDRLHLSNARLEAGLGRPKRHSKQLMMILLRSNIDGTPIRPLVVNAQGSKPHCFTWYCMFLVQYSASKKVRMT